MYELVLPVLPLAVGFLLGSSVKQLLREIYHFFFDVKQTALMVRDTGVLMIQETYETAVMLLRSVLDGILVPIVNATKELMLLVKPVLEIVIVIMKTLILLIQRASALVILIVETVSSLLASLFSTLHNFATNTSLLVSSWTTWIYEGSTNTFFYTVLYLVGFYILAQIGILFIKRLLKKIK